MQDHKQYMEFEKVKFDRLLQKEQAIEQQKSERRITIAQKRKLDEELKRAQEEYDNQINPYQEKADRALKLGINDFSVSDRERANQLIYQKMRQLQI